MDLKDVRVIIAADDGPISRRLRDFLTENGMLVNVVEDPKQLKTLLLEWNPKFLIVDYMFPNWNAVHILKLMQESGIMHDDGCRVFVVSAHSHETNVNEALKRGASDYIVRPYQPTEILSRIVLHLQKNKQIPLINEDDREKEQFYLHLTDLALKEVLNSENLHRSLFNLTNMLAMALKAVRVSVIQCDSNLMIGKVRASSDDRDLNDLKIDLQKYPEVNYVLNGKKMLALDNLKNEPQMQEVLKKVQSISFNSMIVCPIFSSKEHLFGVLSARLPDKAPVLNDYHLRFAQLTARSLGILLKSFAAPENLLEEWPKAS